jgi:small subunit ribosomal protein S20
VATHKSAAKRARQALKRRERNRGIKGRVRTAVKGFLTAADAGDTGRAREELRLAERELRKAASKGVLRKRQVSRRVSRLAKRLARAST